MPAVVEIVEVLGRAASGVSTKPFRCKGTDNRVYYVKLGNAHPKSLFAEWIGGNLAKELGLPIAPFSFVRVSRELFQALPGEFREIGHGVGFGSVAAPPGSRDLLFSDLGLLDVQLAAQVLVFDFWIRNEDRFLSAAGGNPNALYNPVPGSDLLLIDHDNAFDERFNPSALSEGHWARSAARHWMDAPHRASWSERAVRAGSLINEWWADIPEQWRTSSFGDELPGLKLEDVQAILREPFDRPDQFWRQINPS